MIGIEITEGEFLDLYPNTRISLKLNNPLFGDGDFIPGEYSLPFEIPLSDRNVQILKNPDVIKNRLKQRKYTNVRIWYDGLQFKKGTLTISNVLPGKRAAASFTFGLSTIAESLKTTPIKEVCADVIELFDGSTFKKRLYLRLSEAATLGTIVWFSINDTEYTYTVQNGPDFPADYTGLLAVITGDADNNATGSVQTSGPFGAVHQLHIRTDADTEDFTDPLKISDFQNLQVKTNFSSHYDLFNDAAVDYLDEGTAPDDMIRFPKIWNTGIFSEVFDGENLTINQRFSGGFFANSTNDFNHTGKNRSVVVPMVSLKYVLEEIGTSLGLNITGEYLTTEYYLERYFYNMLSINTRVPYVGDVDVLFYADEIVLADHLPDLKISDLIKALKSRYMLSLVFDEASNTISIDTIKSILDNPDYKDITSKAGPLEQLNISDYDQGVILEADQGDQDKVAGEDRYSYGVDPEEILPVKIGSLANGKNATTVPLVHQEDEEPKDLKLVAFDQDVSDNAVVETLEDLSDLVDPYLRVLVDGETVRSSIRMNLYDIMSLDWHQKLRIDQVNYLAKSVDVDLTMKGIMPARSVLRSV
jgi:hypothetical protein